MDHTSSDADPSRCRERPCGDDAGRTSDTFPTRAHPFAGFARLGEIASPEQRLFAFRSLLAELASASADMRIPAPLEGIDAASLEAGLLGVLDQAAFDSLEWMAPERAWPAVYALAAALPAGRTKRGLGRRVLMNLRTCDAATFVAIITQLVLSSASSWSQSPSLRARVALALEVPAITLPGVDALALALVSRRELIEEWLVIPSTGALGPRRRAARILERAAREAARRYRMGDDSGLRVLATGPVEAAFDRLLSDRESLVWRHVAVAVGVIAGARPDRLETVLGGLDPSLGVTGWRRSAVALAASCLLRGTTAFDDVRKVIDGELPRRDPGICAEIVFGLFAVADVDPVVIGDLVARAIDRGGLEAVEATLEMRTGYRYFDDLAFLDARAVDVLDRLDEVPEVDEGKTALAAALRQAATSADLLDEVRLSVARDGTGATADLVVELVGRIGETVDELESLDLRDGYDRMRSFVLLRDLDRSLLESSTLSDLCSACLRPSEQAACAAAIASLIARISRWFHANEGPAARGLPVAHTETFCRMRRVRALLHLLDADDRSAISGVAAPTTRTWLLVSLERLAADASPLHRALCATTARVLDAEVRSGSIDFADVIRLVCAHGITPADLRTLGEASMIPGVEALFDALAIAPGAAPDVVGSRRAIRTLCDALPVASSNRIDALRVALLGIHAALGEIERVVSLSALGHPDTREPLRMLADGLGRIAMIALGSSDRMGLDGTAIERVEAKISHLPQLVARASVSADDLNTVVRLLGSEALSAVFPGPVVRALDALGSHLARLPERASFHGPIFRRSHVPVAAPLPAWMPVHRSMGGFVVERALGGGASGSVFVARRRDERAEDAERFALKVPDYDASAARMLSEGEFLAMFGEEAGALLALPRHPSIARFVTFDAGAKPKPLLVMELVEGRSLEEVLESGAPSMSDAFRWLDGIAAGLEAMHAVGIGHLDLKPANVIVRRESNAPVLVDFGLAGRRTRPGCGTPQYGAPEVWYARPADMPPAAPVDVYAFGCVAFELLTGRLLFDEDEVDRLLLQHATHDGWPPRLAALAADSRYGEVASLISRALRLDPGERASISDLRDGLARIRVSSARPDTTLRLAG